MNEHIHWEKISLLTVVMASVAVVAFVMGKSTGNDGEPMFQKVAVTPVVVTEKVTPGAYAYLNTKYGFSLNLPKSWKKEKTFVKEVEIPGMEGNDPGISLGYTLDQNDQKLGQVAYVYDIYIFPQALWPRKDHDVLVKIGENSSYVFAFLPANDHLENYGYGDYCREHATNQQEFCAAYTDLKNIVSGPAPSEQLYFRAAVIDIPELALDIPVSGIEGDGILYTNHEYDFQLTLPKNWDGYSMKSRLSKIQKFTSFCADELDFSVPEYENIFTISVCTKEQWTKLQKDAEYMANSQNIVVVGENDDYVYLFGQGMLLASGNLPENEPVLEEQLKSVDAIKESFQTYWPRDN